MEKEISLRNNRIGCPFITSSYTEMLLFNILKRINEYVITEKTFQNCKDKNVLPFDFYLINKNLVIECDGMQHFKSVEYFRGNKIFSITKTHDNIKNRFCKENDIPILRIPYTYDPIVDKDKIENFVLDFIDTKQVPQEILNYYNQFEFSNYTKCVTELNEKIIN